MYEISDLFDVTKTIAYGLFDGKRYPWDVLSEIKDYICKLGQSLSSYEFSNPRDGVWIAKDAVVYETAYIGAPCIVDHCAEIRPGAFVRGSVIIGKNCVVGNSTELKNAILFDNVQVPHYNYVGDSVLGYKSHMGAGSVTSNVKSDKSYVVVKNEDELYETGRKKIGAMIGDYAEIGCNSVLNPGTVIGRHTNIYPLSSVRGCIPENCIYKNSADVVKKEKKKAADA